MAGFSIQTHLISFPFAGKICWNLTINKLSYLLLFLSPVTSKTVLFIRVYNAALHQPPTSLPLLPPSLPSTFPQQSSLLDHYLCSLQLTAASLLLHTVSSKHINDKQKLSADLINVTYKVSQPSFYHCGRPLCTRPTRILSPSYPSFSSDSHWGTLLFSVHVLVFGGPAHRVVVY